MSSDAAAAGLLPKNPHIVLWALLATGMFATSAAVAKLAAADYHVMQILFFRQVVVFFSSLPAIIQTFPHRLKTKRPGLHCVRLTGAFIALSAGIWAVAVLPLTTAVTLNFAQVFFIALLAIWVLKEPVGIHRVSAVIAGFIGVLIVMRPGVEGLIDVYAFIPLAGAAGAAVALTSVRVLSQTESAATLLVYQALFVGLLAAIPLYWLWKTPDLTGWIVLIAMGGFAAIAQWASVRALRIGEVSFVGNFQYTQLIYAAILGYILFGEIPDSYTLIGAVIIIASSLYMVHREVRQKQRLS